jgi:hypothetical protein
MTNQADVDYAAAERELLDSRFDDFDMYEPYSRHFPERWPDFLIIGVEKGGTTWLHYNLSYSPEIWIPLVKELHYFNERYLPSKDKWEQIERQRQVFEALEFLPNLSLRSEVKDRHSKCLSVISESTLTDDWYGKIFSYGGSGQLVGEACAHYCLLPRQVISSIISRNTCMKIILMLRDPIDRIWSSLRMAAASGANHAKEIIVEPRKDALWPFFSLTAYPKIMSSWNSIVHRDQIKIVNFDLIADKPEVIIKDICEFLDIKYDPRFFWQAKRPHGAGIEGKIPQHLYALLRRELEPMYQDLLHIIPAFASVWYQRHYR